MEEGLFGPCIAPNRFTPVRRRDSTVNAGRFQGDQEQEWTAARCNRLLRALTSRVAILNKEISRYSSAPLGCEEPKAGVISTSNTADDSEWTWTKKRIRQTYSGRGRGRGRGNGDGPLCGSRMGSSGKGRKSLVPGEVSVPTPILMRVKGENVIPQSVPMVPTEPIDLQGRKRKKGFRAGYMTNDSRSNFQLSETLREMRKKVTAARYTTYEGIYNGLEALLRSTAKGEPETKRKGARSLLSMSLKVVPRYISQQEILLSAHIEETGSRSAISSRDISTEIYDELEAFGSSGHSWKQLRMVVRSHGVQVVSDAIRDGLLDAEFSGVIITLCVHTSAMEEAEILLSALLYSSHFAEPKTLYDTANRRLRMLWKFTEYTGRVSFQYRQLAGLLADGVLPVAWLATKEFSPIWTALIQLSSPESINPDAFTFLNTSLPLLSMAGSLKLSGRNASAVVNSTLSEAIKTTFSSLLAILLSIFILFRETQLRDTHNVSGYQHIVTLMRGSLVQCKLLQVSSNSQDGLLLLANLVVGQEPDDILGSKAASVDLLLGQLRQQDDNFLDISTTYNDLVLFICNVARCCGRGASTSGFDYLEELHMLLETLGCDRDDSDVLKGIIVDSAYSFSQKVPDRKHLDYAVGLDAKFAARVVESSLGPMSDIDETRSGFRWEEGIGEWVTVTPVFNNAKHKTAGEYSMMEEEDTECDTPFRPPPHLRRRTGAIVLQSLDESLSLSNNQPGNLSDEAAPSNQSFASESDDELLANPAPYDEALESDELMSEAEESFIEDSFASDRASASFDDIDSNRSRPVVRRAPRLNRGILRNSQDWQLFDASSLSSASSTTYESHQSKSSRQCVDRAPRLGRRALRSSQAWQIFDESDDELSFVSVSSQTSQVMQDITNTKDSKTHNMRLRQRPLIHQKAVVAPALSDSEDELCI